MSWESPGPSERFQKSAPHWQNTKRMYHYWRFSHALQIPGVKHHRPKIPTCASPLKNSRSTSVRAVLSDSSLPFGWAPLSRLPFQNDIVWTSDNRFTSLMSHYYRNQVSIQAKPMHFTLFDLSAPINKQSRSATTTLKTTPYRFLWQSYRCQTWECR